MSESKAFKGGLPRTSGWASLKTAEKSGVFMGVGSGEEGVVGTDLDEEITMGVELRLQGSQ